MVKTNTLIFKDAEKARDAITKEQKKKIANLYEQWANEIGKTADKFGSKKNPSAAVSEAQMRELKKQLLATRDQTIKEVESSIKSSLVEVADAVVSSNVKWLEGFGFPKSGLNAAFTNVPKNIVEKLVTGNLYEGRWSLSKAIWGDSEKTMSDVYKIVAGGLAKNQSVYEVAKDIQKYVSPSAKKDWNLTDKDGRKIYPKKVDYAAQRLVRTLAQHSYQQAFKETTEKNPFITKYRWNANGSRACEICKKRDGKLFDKDKLPLDHPNGMCVMEPVMKSDEEITDELAAWVNGEDGDYPAIDKFAKQFGYNVNVKDKVAQKASKTSKTTSGKVTKAAATKASEATTKAPDIAKKTADNDDYNSWIDKIKSQTTKQMLDLEEKELKKLTKENLETLKNYTGGSFLSYNNYLRNKALNKGKFTGILDDETRKRLDDLVDKLSSIKTEERYVLRRGTDMDDVFYTFFNKDEGMKEKLADIMYKMEDALGDDDAEEKLAEEIRNLVKGRLGSFSSFTSTSSEWSKGFPKDIEYVIDAPPGTAGTSIMGVSNYGEKEGEFLLAPGTKIVCEDVQYASDGHKRAIVRVFLRVIV